MSSKFQSLTNNMPAVTEHTNTNADIRIENFIGYIKVPLGLAGPLSIHPPNGEKEEIHAPLATTEAALIASCCRGTKAFNLCGGIQFDILGEGMVRAPLFRFPSPREAIAFSRQMAVVERIFAGAAEATSRHLRLKKIIPHVIGRRAHLYISYYSGDAAGQNMVTIATQYGCERIMEGPLALQLNIEKATLEGQMASDKKPSWGNVKQPRGVEVMAWGSLSNDVCQRVLGCTTAELHRWHNAFLEGGIRNGQFGSNVNTANIVAGIFVAAGQDAASIGEGCWSHLVMDYMPETERLVVSLYFPSLPVGVVGGGTLYPTQKECLEMMKCRGTGGKKRLAGIIASFALALEVSTAAALATNTFSQAHQRLARKSRL
ncbi:hypothetical protein ASPWEDRAFT_174784 [Aspergillus wentii DTO 134E9]|uniref:hydroxymethylglutaryl-CoA reductase (NADPH) n=1 Tax=Aspergillus wentii DTO 134E9 TaxID=1073089 RepID=A0A1L9REN6_ASPWE|nr:uncharacterized protein ASPWEDRAFT_174784 [Aspergillus wentii DTO 134E9]KAI9933622.1 hypothetical protein MW887_008095 [Aspergillus wentii]OJJ33375.1 hypothetical protein ASPWEDRAFT_174784 [Aspergillus wentii DTO 134E9]